MIGLDQANAADAPALARILGDWCRDTAWMPKLHSRDEDLAFLHHLLSTTSIRVARRGPAPDAPALGFLARNETEIAALYLAPEARGQGIGAALLAEAQAASPLLRLWTFQANPGAIRFYTSAGFVEIARTDGSGNDERLPDLRLEWRAGAAPRPTEAAP